MTQRPPAVPSDEHDDSGAAAPAIPGAWAQPASAFADESSVVRPDRRDGARSSGRVMRLLVLAALAAGTSAFAWGVTVALQSLDEDEAAALPTVADSASPARPAANKSPNATAGAPSPTSVVASAALAAEEAAPAAVEDPTAGEPPVPAADPSFPELPPATDDDADSAGDDIPAPKRLRLARAASEGDDDDVTPRKARYQRQLKKKQRLARVRAKKGRATERDPDDAAATTSADTAPANAVATPVTAASLTREAERLFAAGALGDARAVAERALEKSRGYPRAHRALAVICAKQGDSACARKGYETYLKLAPGAPDAPDVRRILGM